MNPGDALFFHSNTLHASDSNESEDPRWAMICCYNAASNDPYKDSHHPRYTKLEKVEDDQILTIDQKESTDVRTVFADLSTEDSSASSLSE